MMDALQGLRVVDFSKVLAGPLCTQYLGDMGAEIIKVESPLGDDTRRWPPFHKGEGTVFLSVNRNKRSILLDLKSEASRDVVQRLLKTADIVVESFGPGVPERLGIDYDSVAALRPDVIYCSITGFGTQGPLREGKGYDVILQAYSGMLALTGEETGPPARSPISPIDQATGMHAAMGIVSAVVKRLRTGQGMRIDASLFDTSLAFMAYVMQSYWERGTDPKRWGSAHESLCPYQVFDTRDHPILLGVANDALWQTFCRVVNDTGLAQDPRYETNAGRVSHREQVLKAVGAHMVHETRDAWMEKLSRAGIPCAPILSISEVLAHPHTLASGMIQHLPFAGGELNTVSQPLRFDGERSMAQYPPPTLGEHTETILASLGYEPEQIRQITSGA